MTVVDEHLSIRAIEDKIASGLVEELIIQAHNEVKLLKIMKNWKPWEFLLTRDSDFSEDLRDTMNFSNGNPFPVVFERYDTTKHSPHERSPTAAVHPEEKN